MCPQASLGAEGLLPPAGTATWQQVPPRLSHQSCRKAMVGSRRVGNAPREGFFLGCSVLSASAGRKEEAGRGSCRGQRCWAGRGQQQQQVEHSSELCNTAMGAAKLPSSGFRELPLGCWLGQGQGEAPPAVQGPGQGLPSSTPAETRVRTWRARKAFTPELSLRGSSAEEESCWPLPGELARGGAGHTALHRMRTKIRGGLGGECEVGLRPQPAPGQVWLLALGQDLRQQVGAVC